MASKQRQGSILADSYNGGQSLSSKLKMKITKELRLKLPQPGYVEFDRRQFNCHSNALVILTRHFFGCSSALAVTCTEPGVFCGFMSGPAGSVTGLKRLRRWGNGLKTHSKNWWSWGSSQHLLDNF